LKLLRRGIKRLPHQGCIIRVETRQPHIALTFDDGPDPTFTPPLLDLLRRHRAKGTFFMIGEAASRHLDLVRRVAREGHAIGNHTWDHSAVSVMSWRETRAQIQDCQQALGPHGRRIFRPPYLAQSKLSVLNARLLGFQVIMASLDSGDWWNPDARSIGETLLAGVSPGEIVLLHDGLAGFSGLDLPHPPLPDRSAMLTGLDWFLTKTAGRFRFVTVPGLLASGKPVREKRYNRGPKPRPG
jgi:peptidoglycan-N-acetylglucosamine deacetylase